MTRLFSLLLIGIFVTSLDSCCDPKPIDSLPEFVTGSYKFEPVKDVSPLGFRHDSEYYPIYSFQLKNTGSQSDTFKITFDKLGYGFTLHEFAPAGETILIRTPGPIPDTAVPNAQQVYYTFFASTPDSVDIRILQPKVTISYGESFNGSEGCNSAPIVRSMNPADFN